MTRRRVARIVGIVATAAALSATATGCATPAEPRAAPPTSTATPAEARAAPPTSTATAVPTTIGAATDAVSPTSADTAAPDTSAIGDDAGPPDSTSPAAAPPSTTSVVAPSSSTAGPVDPIPADRPLRVLVVGDSVAASLAPGRDDELVVLPDGVEVRIRNVGSVACPIILDGGWWFTDGSTLPDNPVCDRPERYDDEVASFAPDVVLTVFGWPGAGGGQRFSDGEIAVPCEPRFDAAWEAGYRDVVGRVSTGAAAIVSTIAPIAMDTRRAETACLNEIVRRLPAPVLDLQEWLCPGLDCSWSSDLRPDGVHFANEPELRRVAVRGVAAELVDLLRGTTP